MTIGTLAGELYDALETRSRTDGEEFICLKNGSPAWMSAAVHVAHGGSMPADAVYDFIQQCASAISDVAAADESEARDAVNQIEPDVYTGHLTAWLAQNSNHVQYLSEVLKENEGIEDGTMLLRLAQQKHIHEVGDLLVTALQSHLERKEDEQ